MDGSADRPNTSVAPGANPVLRAFDVRAEVHHHALKSWPALVSDALWRFIAGAPQSLHLPAVTEVGCSYGLHIGEDDVVYQGIDYGYFVDFAAALHPTREFLKVDFGRSSPRELTDHVMAPRLILVTERLEHVPDPDGLLAVLAEAVSQGCCVVIAARSGANIPEGLERRRVPSAALEAAVESYGLKTEALPSLPRPDGATDLSLTVVSAGERVAEEARALKSLVVQSIAAAQPLAEAGSSRLDGEGESITPNTMFFEPDADLVSDRLVRRPAAESDLDTDAVATRILAAKADRRPFSIVRIGNGEARVLGFPDYVTPVWLARSFRNWFRSRDAELSIAPLQDEMSDAIGAADIVGVLRKRYVDPQYFMPVRLIELYGLLGEQAERCEADIHLHLLNAGFYRELLQGEDRVSLVTAHDLGAEVAATFAIGDVALYRVPGQAKFFHDPSSEPHFPAVFERLRAGITVRVPGEIFLVGAGYLGKIYCDWIKSRGGIAVDVGSVFDLWAGEHTRGKDPSVAERHRLGAGDQASPGQS